MVKKLLFNLHRFKKGKTVSIFVIHECNLDCSYCSAQFIKGRFPNIKTILYAQQWMDILAKDKDIKIVEISGGEPLMYPYIAQLLVLLSKKYYVRVYSNLMVKRNLKRSWKVRFRATFHHESSENKFKKHLKYYKKKFLIDVDEIEFGVLRGSQVKPLTKNEDEKNCKAEYVFSSDGRKWNHHNEIERNN